MKHHIPAFVSGLSALLLLGALPRISCAADPGAVRAPDSLALPTSPTRAVDAAGFIRRWLVLEPVSVSGRLTEDEVQKSLQAASLSGSPDTLPHDGDTATVADQPLRWHALDTLRYNLNLYHFAWSLSKPTSNVLFWVVTVIDSPREMHGVRLAIGSNAASTWWLNGEKLVALYNDRQSVIDDGVSRRVTLRKGRNVIRAAIVNGGGATDFCARFLDAGDHPVTGLNVRLGVP